MDCPSGQKSGHCRGDHCGGVAVGEGSIACEAQTYFRSSLLSLRKLTIFGGRQATTDGSTVLAIL